MSKFIIRIIISTYFLSVPLLAITNASAEPFTFSYTFVGTDTRQPYAPGSKLFGQIDGTVDPLDSNRVIINSFGTVSLSRPGFPLHIFPTIDADEFNTLPSGNTPVMSFDPLDINVRACPNGFTQSAPGTPFDDCSFAFEGGFNVVSELSFVPGLSSVFAADGSGSAVCGDSSGAVLGCRVTDRQFGPLAGSWELVTLPDGIDPSVVIDPTVTIGSNTSVNQGVVLEENVDLGNNVAVNKNTSIGSNTIVGNQVILNKDGDVGSSVLIGDDVIIGQKVVVEGGVQIGAGAIINRNVYICSDVVIGSLAVIGKNQVIKDDVPATGELPGIKSAPDPDDPTLCL